VNFLVTRTSIPNHSLLSVCVCVRSASNDFSKSGIKIFPSVINDAFSTIYVTYLSNSILTGFDYLKRKILLRRQQYCLYIYIYLWVTFFILN
jgi:hypothetical protein